MLKFLFFPADAHEGPVWIARQQRLYYATKPHPKGRNRVDLEYLDFSPFLENEQSLSELSERAQRYVSPKTFVKGANMANALRAARDGKHLLVAEQGDMSNGGGIAAYDIRSGQRTPIVNENSGFAFNSPNKVIETKDGHLIFSDPDYGFRNGFRPPPVLEPMLYLLPKGQDKPIPFRCQLEMPHGLELSADEKTLFVTDTSNDGVHAKDVDLNRQHSVWKFGFDPEVPAIYGPGEYCFEVAKGVPDGMTSTKDEVLVGGGDGIYVADMDGQLTGKITTTETAVNVCLTDDHRHLFATMDKGVLLLLNWREFVGKKVTVPTKKQEAAESRS